MMDVTLSILALIAGGVTLEVFVDMRAARRPRAQQAFSLAADASDLSQDLQVGNPS